MSAIFISASPGVKASALSWLIGEGVREGGDWGACSPPRKAEARGQGPRRAAATSYGSEGRPPGLCSWQQACALMEDLCANWEQSCSPCRSAGLPG